MSRVQISVIKAGLQGRVERLVRELIPGGRREAGRWKAKNPTRNDREAGSFVVWLTGQAPGCFKDYATGDKGDVLDLVAYVKGGERGDAIKWATNWLGLGLVDNDTLRRMEADAERRRREADRETARRDADKVARAFRMWRDASPAIRGTPVEAYLARRGIPLDQVPNLEGGEIRFRRLEWWKGATGFGRDRVPGPEFPAMVCAIRAPAGEIRAVHCTFLAEEGSGKAPVAAPKLMYGLVAGCVIRLTRGPSGMKPEDARAAGISGPVAVGEGVEDGLSIALGAPEARVWAATSLGNLGNVDLSDPCVSAAVVAQDNDWGKAQALAAFETAIERLEAHGKPVAVMRAHVGKDFNDELRGKSG